MKRVLPAVWVLALTVAACSRKPASISVSPTPVKIYGLERAQRLSGQVLDKKGNPIQGTAPAWSSSKPAIAAVDASGRVVAKGEGRALVTASYQGVSTQVPVEVVDVREIAVSPASVQLIGPIGTQIPLTATVRNSKNKAIALRVGWSSSNPKIGAVSSEGIVSSAGPGTTTVVAKVGDLLGAAEVVVLVREIARLEIRPATGLVRVGDSQHFEVIAYSPDGKTIEGAAAMFRSSDPAVATVDGSGVAVGIAAGITTIQATLAGISAEATLLVN